MNDRTFDSDDAENQDPDEGEQRSLEDRWYRFLTGEADEERRLRMEKRRERLREERDSEEDPGGKPKAEGSDEETAGQPESEGDVEAEPIPDELDEEASAPDEPVSDEPDEEGTAGDTSPQFQLETDSERRRARTREERISESRLFATGDEDPGVDEDLGVDEEPAPDEDPPEPRTRAEELRALGKDRPGTADPGESADPGTPSPGPDVPDAGPDEDAPDGSQEPPPAADRDAPVVIPAQDRMDLPAWRRHWKPIAAGVAVVLIAIFAVRGIGGGGGGTADEGASPAGAEAASAVDVDRAEALTDSLETALGRYRERRQDFDLDRLDCAGLARGYEEVRSALGELRSAVPYADDLAAGPLRSSYRSLVSSVETVEEGYADTGCAGSA